MNNWLKMLTPPEPLGQCDSNFIGMFQTVWFIQMMSLTFDLFTQVSGSGPLGPLVFWKVMGFKLRRTHRILSKTDKKMLGLRTLRGYGQNCRQDHEEVELGGWLFLGFT